MSVISELIKHISNSGFQCVESSLEKKLTTDNKYNEFVTVIETSADFESSSDSGRDYEITHTLEVGIYVKRSNDDESISRAKFIRDTILDIVNSAEFDDTHIFISRIDSEFLEDQNRYGYKIELSYKNWDIS